MNTVEKIAASATLRGLAVALIGMLWVLTPEMARAARIGGTHPGAAYLE